MENKDFETLFDEEMMRADLAMRKNACKEIFNQYCDYIEAGFSEEQAFELVKLMMSKMIEVSQR